MFDQLLELCGHEATCSPEVVYIIVLAEYHGSEFWNEMGHLDS